MHDRGLSPRGSVLLELSETCEMIKVQYVPLIEGHFVDFFDIFLSIFQEVVGDVSSNLLCDSFANKDFFSAAKRFFHPQETSSSKKLQT